MTTTTVAAPDYAPGRDLQLDSEHVDPATGRRITLELFEKPTDETPPPKEEGWLAVPWRDGVELVYRIKCSG